MSGSCDFGSDSVSQFVARFEILKVSVEVWMMTRVVMMMRVLSCCLYCFLYVVWESEELACFWCVFIALSG